MSDHDHWRDAEQARTWLESRELDRRILSLLAHLPLADALLLSRLAGFQAETAVYHHLRHLQQSGLIAGVRLPLGPGSSPHRYHLTDLGLATLAFDWDCEPSVLATRYHLRRSDLLGLLPGIPQLAAAYEMLGALAAAHAGPPVLVAWERPWRRRYRRATAKTATSICLPAAVQLAWGGVCHSYVLVPDLGTVPVHVYRSVLNRLLVFRGTPGSDLPPLLVATGRDRIAGWDQLLDETRRARWERPIAAHVVDWADLHTRLQDIVQRNRGDGDRVPDMRRPANLPLLQRRRSGTPLPRLVGPPLDAATGACTAVIVTLSPAERALLDLVARHPFLTPDQLTSVTGWRVEKVRRRWNRLRAAELLRILTVEEVGKEAWNERAEASGAGLRLVAAQQGLTLAAAVRVHGLAGGGPEEPVGTREVLLRNLTHTAAADELFVGLYQIAREHAEVGGDDAVVVWQNAAACSRRHLRPDGYGTYRHHDRLHGFFLECDRGTMNRRDYFQKFAAYHDYAITRRFDRDYHGYPTILVVTTTNTAEERIATVVRRMSVGRNVKLPLLITTRWRLDDPSNGHGLLGRVWREPVRAFDERRFWLPAPRSEWHEKH